MRDSRRSLPALLVGLAGAAVLLGGCSLNLFQYSDCTATAECRGAFGRGWVCGEEGLCELAPAEPRCSSYPPDVIDDLPSYEDHILIGNLFDSTDFELMQRSARLAVIQANTRDGLDGTPFGMIECTNQLDFDGDGLDENEATAKVGAYMAGVLGLPSIIGPATSTRTEIAYNTDSPFGTLHISPSATSPALTDLDGGVSTDADPGLLWRTCPPDSLQGEVQALEMIARGIERVGVVAEVGAYGEGLAEVFQESFNGDGRSSELATFVESSELGSIAATYNAVDFEAVLVISSVTAFVADFLVAASPLSDYPNKLIFLADGAFDMQTIEESEENASDLYANVLGTVPATPSGLAYDTFRASYLSVFNQDPADFGFSAHSYDAAWLAIIGAAWSLYHEGDVTGVGTARGMRRVSSGDDYNTGPNDWNSIRAAFAASEAIDIAGASGSLDYDPVTAETTSAINVWGIVDDGEGGWELSVLYCVDVSDNPSPECVDPGGPAAR